MKTVLERADIEADVLWEDSVLREEVDVDESGDDDAPLLHELTKDVL